jgi:single-stranded-DNA-specific exonuclease
MEKRWLFKALPTDTRIDEIRSILKLDSICTTLLCQRGIDTLDAAKAFFYPNLNSLHDPFLMLNMPTAVKRLASAIEQKERVLVYGDYDVDGTSAVAMMHTFLQSLGVDVHYYIPDRYTEGYGVSIQGMDWANEQGIQLIITLDCGIRSTNSIAHARNYGIDVIVCDHHEPGDELPAAIILDPKQKGCMYPFKELSGCGVGFKLLDAYCRQVGRHAELLNNQLDLLAISIGADIVQLTGENRVLCAHGLNLLNEKPRNAFRALIQSAKREFPLTLTDVVFTIAPRINAAGRLRSGRFAVELMISTDETLIHQLAQEIEADNVARKQLDQQITHEALELIKADENYSNKRTTVVYKPDWHKGVVGIVASRLMEKHYRPTIVLTESNGFITGSARTIEAFDVHEALVACSDLLIQFGGHTHAAGLTLSPENLLPFQNRFDQLAHQQLVPADLSPELFIDMEISFDQFFEPNENRFKLPKLKRLLDRFEPHGPGNMKPHFIARNVYASEVRILKEQHLKLRVLQTEADIILDAIGFGLAQKQDQVAAGLPFDMVFTLDKNSWKNNITLQLNIKDIRASL